MAEFLLWIGLYNALGALLLPALAIWPRFADRLLSTWVEISVPPYDHGAHGALWVWWAASVNAFLGVVMLLATRWDAFIQREVILAVIGVYLAMWAVAIAALRSPRYNRRGLYAVILVMWPAQMIWGLWTALAARGV